MDFLRDCLIAGTVTPCYMDTDSISIATCRTRPLRNGMTVREEMEAIFDPIIRPEKKEYWYANWDKWLVLTNKVEDEKRPGLLKSKLNFICPTLVNSLAEFMFTNGTFIGLGPKTYCTYDADHMLKSTPAYKLGHKGIPNRLGHRK